MGEAPGADAVLRRLIDPAHPLAVLADRMPWRDIETRAAHAWPPSGADPRRTLRTMAALLCLERACGEDDESVIERWAHDVYFQYFGGMEHFRPHPPCDAADIARFRHALGEPGVHRLLEAAGAAAAAAGVTLRGRRWGTHDDAAQLALYREVFRESPDFISFCRLDDVYVDVNPGFEQFVGLTRDRIVGRTALDIGLWPDGTQRDAFIDEVRRRGALLGYRRRLARHGGELRDVEGWASIVDVGDGPILVAIGRDVTELRRDEAELHAYRDHLEQLVDQRTRELSEANHRLQEASRAKSTFLASMSHELRTPLNAVLGYAQLLRMGPNLSERQRTGLATIEQGGQHLLALINDILDLARVEAGKLELAASPVSVSAFVAVVCDIMRVRAEEKSLLFRCEAPQPLHHVVLADEKRLRQILLNLLGNAVKFTDAGEVVLRVAAQEEGARLRLGFEVQDSGIGIPPAQADRLFKPFEQLSDAGHRSGGAGLGLSISQALARLMGGEIRVQSEPGRGSRFSLELLLPLHALHEPARAAPALGPVTGYPGRRRRVLVVDDTAPSRTLLQDTLGLLGFDTHCAADGREGVAQAERLRPDLIVMDVVMPDVDGLEATRRLRATAGLGPVRIIAVSASASRAQAADCLAAGADAFLPKPIQLPDLLEHIGRLLDLDWVR